MSVNGVGTGLAIQAPCLLCERIGELAKSVHDFVMKVIHAIRDYFCGSPATTLNIRSVTMGGPLNLVAFYRGLEPNNNGVTLNQIRAWGDGQLESVHNYIQWLFPLMTPSSPNPTAAVLDTPTMQTFRSDPALKNQVLISFQRMLSFYGLQMNAATKMIIRAPNFRVNSAVWLTPGNHNFLRITRMIRSMDLLGLSDYSKSFFSIMQDIRIHEGRGIISDYTFRLWQSACPR